MISRAHKKIQHLSQLPIVVFALGCLVIGLGVMFLMSYRAPAAPLSVSIPGATASSSSVIVSSSPCDPVSGSNVDVALTSALPSTVPGTQLGIAATLKNNNPYPVYDGILYVRVVADATSTADTRTIDEFVAERSIDMAGSATATSTFVWKVPATAESSSYHLQGYFVFPHRPFVAPLFGTVAQSIPNDLSVAVLSGAKSGVAIDVPHSTVNGAAYDMSDRAFFSPHKPITVKVALTNDTIVPYVGSVEWRLYKGVYSPLSQPDVKRGEAKIHPHKGAELSYTLTDPFEDAYYLEAIITKGGVPTAVMGVPMVRDGVCGSALFGQGASAKLYETIAIVAALILLAVCGVFVAKKML